MKLNKKGFGVAEMEKIAGWIDLVIRDFENSRESVAKEVLALTEKFPIYED